MADSGINVEDAEPSFLAMLAQAGVDRAQPDVPKTWAVFKAFARLPVACAEDDLLVECGTPLDESGPFRLSFKRQFVIEKGSGYDHMEQLVCQFTYERHQELEDLHLSLWSMGFATLDAYFAHIEGLLAFQVPMSRYVPVAVDIFQEAV